MTNWCYNLLSVVGQPADRHTFRVLAAGRAPRYAGDAPDSEVRLPLAFNALVPMPTRVRRDPGERLAPRWQREHWGTVWELTEETKVMDLPDWEMLLYDFDTAWTPPIAWVERVAVRFSRLEFTLAYLEPDMEFGGTIRCADGRISESLIEHDRSALQAFALMQFGLDLYGQYGRSGSGAPAAITESTGAGGTDSPEGAASTMA
jgi:hypothetical protein